MVVGRGGCDDDGAPHDAADGGWDGDGGAHDDGPGAGMAKAWAGVCCCRGTVIPVRGASNSEARLAGGDDDDDGPEGAGDVDNDNGAPPRRLKRWSATTTPSVLLGKSETFGMPDNNWAIWGSTSANNTTLAGSK